jgi:hypothetical protein
MVEYNILTFLEIIESEGCLCLREICIDGESIKWYLSKNGNRRVAIAITDEEMTIRTASNLLIQLELDDLIERLFGKQGRH